MIEDLDINDQKIIADELNHYYTNMGISRESDQVNAAYQTGSRSPTDSLRFDFCTPEEIYKVICKCKPKKNSNGDKISMFFLKKVCNGRVCESLAKFVNLSIAKGVVPT